MSSIAAFYVFAVPFTKVEESFNVQVYLSFVGFFFSLIVPVYISVVILNFLINFSVAQLTAKNSGFSLRNLTVYRFGGIVGTFLSIEGGESTYRSFSD